MSSKYGGSSACVRTTSQGVLPSSSFTPGGRCRQRWNVPGGDAASVLAWLRPQVLAQVQAAPARAPAAGPVGALPAPSTAYTWFPEEAGEVESTTGQTAQVSTKPFCFLSTRTWTQRSTGWGASQGQFVRREQYL